MLALKRRRLLERVVEEKSNSTPALLKQIVAVLERIEDEVDDLGAPAGQAKSSLAAGAPAPEAAAYAPSKAIVEEMAPIPSPLPEGPVAPEPVPAPAPVAPATMTEHALAMQIREHDVAIDAARDALVARIQGIDAELARLRPPGQDGGRQGRGGKRGGGKAPGPVNASGGGTSKVTAKRIGGAATGREPGDIRLGDHAHRVRCAARSAGRAAGASTAGRRRATGSAVRAVQHILGRPVTGVGFYPNGNFVHGDFDDGLGRREWNGP